MRFLSLALTAIIMPALLLVSCSDDDNPAGPGTPHKVKTWSGTYGGTDAEWAVSAKATPDGGYIAVGGIVAAGTNNQDFLLVKVDSDGKLVWQKTYGGALADFGRAVTVTADGGYIAVGSTYSFGVGNSDVYFVKTDASGNVEWEKTYGGDKWETVHEVVVTASGGYAAAGWTSSFGAPGGSDGWLVVTDAVGEPLLQKQYGGGNEDALYSLAQTRDGGFILAGETKSFGVGSSDIFLLKVDDSCDFVWRATCGGPGFDFATGVVETSGGYVAAGWVGSDNLPNYHGAYDAYVVKLNLDGALLWESCYGDAGYDGCEEIVATRDGGFVVGGHLQDMGTGGTTGYLFKINSSGDLLWQRTFGNSSEAVEGVTRARDGGFMLAGAFYTEDPIDVNLYLVKTDASGMTLDP